MSSVIPYPSELAIQPYLQLCAENGRNVREYEMGITTPIDHPNLVKFERNEDSTNKGDE